MGPQRPPQGPQQSHMDAMCSMRSRDTKLHCEEKEEEEEEEEKEKKEAKYNFIDDNIFLAFLRTCLRFAGNLPTIPQPPDFGTHS